MKKNMEPRFLGAQLKKKYIKWSKKCLLLPKLVNPKCKIKEAELFMVNKYKNIYSLLKLLINKFIYI